MSVFVFADMHSEDISHIVFYPWLLRCRAAAQLHMLKSLFYILVVRSTTVTAPPFRIRFSKINFRALNFFSTRNA